MSSPELCAHRSYLYVAGSDPHRFAKARASGADAIIIDLEDAVATEAKDVARRHLADYVRRTPVGPAAVHVRINAPATGFTDADLDAAVAPVVETLRVPKVEEADDIRMLDERLSGLEATRGMAPGAIGLCLLIESAKGVLAFAETAAASSRVTSVALGSTDFLADIGAQGDDDMATLHARSHLVLVARAQGLLAPIDSVTTTLSDPDAVARTARFARGLGFFGKSLIHPAQIAAAHEVFSPTAAELERARAIVAAADAALASGSGATTYHGEFVDPAVVARHRALLATGKDNR